MRGKPKPKETGLHGSEIINRLQRGHFVRRAAWIDDYYIRICNEDGFDENGLAIVDGRSAIYTYSTMGYFYHIGHSVEPLREPYVYWSSTDGFQISRRSREGLEALFENDWEDYGFVDYDHFQVMVNSLRDAVRDAEKQSENDAIDMAWEMKEAQE